MNIDLDILSEILYFDYIERVLSEHFTYGIYSSKRYKRGVISYDEPKLFSKKVIVFFVRRYKKGDVSSTPFVDSQISFESKEMAEYERKNWMEIDYW